MAKVFFLHLHVIGRDIQGHETRSLQVKLARYLWTQDKVEYF